MNLLFFPGGPGFNSNPELNLLQRKYKQQGINLIGWHEPSSFRPLGDSFSHENAFQNYLDSVERFFLKHYDGRPLPVFAFCFGSHPVAYLLKKHPEKISHALIVTPDFCLPETDRNIFCFVMDDYNQYNDPRAAQLQQILNNYSRIFDRNMEAGFRMAADNPRLFHYYWRDEKLMQNFLQYYTGVFQIDVEGFLAVRRSKFEIELRNCFVPVIVMYGKYDRIISVNHELNNLPRLFGNLKIMEMSKSSHYPHIEEADEVLSIIKK